MWESFQFTATALALITGVGTIGSWFVAGRNRGNRVPSRQRPKGAWERAAALSSLTKVSNDPYIETMASAAARSAAEAEAFAAIERSVRIPTVLAGLYLGIVFMGFWPKFDLIMTLVGGVGAIVFFCVAVVHHAQNQGDRISIHTLVEQSDELILQKPFEALRQHKQRRFRGNGGTDVRITLQALRFRAVRLRDERDAVRRRASELDERARILERRERTLVSNYSLRRD